MTLIDDSLADLFEQYKDEVKETIETLDSELVAIEQDPTNSEVIFSLFRHLHSLKGSSKMFNVDNIGHIAHKLEDLMQLIDQDNSILAKHSEIVTLLFQGNDIFREIIHRLESDISYVNLTPEHARLIEKINHLLDLLNRNEDLLLERARAMADEVETLLPSLDEIETESLRRCLGDLKDAIRQAGLDRDSESIAYTYGGANVTRFVVDLEKGLAKFESGKFSPEDIKAFFDNAEQMLQALFEVADEPIMDALAELNDGLDMYQEKSLEVDEIVIEFFKVVIEDLKTRFKTETVTDVEEQPAPEQPKPAAARGTGPSTSAPPKTQAKTIRVDEAKIDLFLESVGKLITQSEILNHLQTSFKGAGLKPALIRDFSSINRTISNDIVTLQRSIMEVRQVEMDNILKKFPRLVRDISHKMNKEVALEIAGERIPIDKSLLDDVEQAMIHVVRNAIDHGLETPEEREAAGKGRRGLIRIEVIQEEASILVEMSDDGRGVDFEAVRRRALERGLVDKDVIDSLDNKELESLLYRSGLTTKDEATDISGRGVGLDVVLSNIRKWNGEVTLENRPNQGLTIRLRIPITNTLLTKEAIVLRLGDSTFCLPLEYVVEIVTVPRDRIHHHKDQAVFQHRNQVVGVVDVKELLGMGRGLDSEDRPVTFLILRGKIDSRKAIAADEILGQQKIVIKDFEIEAFRRMPYYLGLTLMGDGRVVLVLDAEEIAG